VEIGCAQTGGPTDDRATREEAVVGGTVTAARPEFGIFSDDCSMVLIAPRYALTAAHCVDYSTTEDVLFPVSVSIVGSDNRATNILISRIHLFGATADDGLAGSAQDPQCQSFTYAPVGFRRNPRTHCWLKSGVAAAARREGLVSGINGAAFF
jgi:hypothetical protein